MAVSPYLDTHCTILLILVFVCLPICLILLRCFVFKNVPKLDLFFLVCAIGTWSLALWSIILFGTSIYCDEDCVPFGGLKETGNIMALILLTILCPLLSIVFEPAHAFGWGCGCTENPPPMPIDLNPTPVETMRDIIKRIETTGPTLTAGVVKETHAITNKNNRTSFWALVDWDQFPYHAWAMNMTPYPYFHEEQD